MPDTTASEIDRPVEATHASDAVVHLVSEIFATKSTRDAERTMTYFAPESITYTDTTIGDTYRNWTEQKAAFSTLMGRWQDGARSYPARVLGDERSALVVFVDSPEMFGKEVRIMAPMDFRDGKVVRQVDYWDGRPFGAATLEQFRVPLERVPTEFGESTAGEQADPTLQATARALSAALSSADADAAADLFTTDAVFEDVTLRLQLIGAAIRVYLGRALGALPYGPGTRLRHAVGSAEGGGFEWTGDGPVKNGVIALELAPDGRISRMTAVWDGSRVDAATVTALVGYAIEQ